MKKIVWACIIKLLIINALIIAFGFGFYNLMEDALAKPDSTFLAILATTLGVPLIALITLEIHMVYKLLGNALHLKTSP